MAITHNIISINIFIFFYFKQLAMYNLYYNFLTMLQIAKLPSCWMFVSGFKLLNFMLDVCIIMLDVCIMLQIAKSTSGVEFSIMLQIAKSTSGVEFSIMLQIKYFLHTLHEQDSLCFQALSFSLK